MVLTTGAPVPESTVALAVATGTWSPTCKVATWLSSTTTDGVDSTFTSETARSALRIRFGWLSGPSRKLKPGSVRARIAVVPAVISPDPLSGCAPTSWLERKACTP